MNGTERIPEAYPGYWEAVELLRGLIPAGPEAIGHRVAVLRGIVKQAREKAAARRVIVRLLEIVSPDFPDEAATFREYYLEGQKQSTRQAGRTLYMDKRTLQRHTRRILEAMLAPAFGIYGIFLTDQEREERGEEVKIMNEFERDFCILCAHGIEPQIAASTAKLNEFLRNQSIEQSAATATALLEREDIRAAIEAERDKGTVTPKKEEDSTKQVRELRALVHLGEEQEE